MKVTYCPHCLNTTIVADRDWGGTVQCEAPRCEKFFHSSHAAGSPSVLSLVSTPSLPVETSPQPVATYGPVGPPPFTDPDPPSNGALPQLTGPHRCQVCFDPDDLLRLGEMNEAFGRRRWSRTHHNPLREESCRTDLYAAIYRCPGCLSLLETPSYQWGTEVTCPVESCRRVFTAPRDDVLHRIEGDAKEGVPFLFPCPACGRHLRCDTARDGRPTTGLLVVCIHPDCRQRIEIPASGRQAVRPPSVLDPIQAVQTAAQRRCRGCHAFVPANAVPCPLCGHPGAEDAPLV
jgi:hypothetical protein